MTLPEQHILLIPIAGLIEVFHTEKQVDAEGTLRLRGAEGEFVSLSIENSPGTVHWFVNPVGQVNPRAREAFTMIMGVHLIFTGPVLFTDVDAEKVYEIVAELSRKE